MNGTNIFFYTIFWRNLAKMNNWRHIRKLHFHFAVVISCFILYWREGHLIFLLLKYLHLKVFWWSISWCGHVGVNHAGTWFFTQEVVLFLFPGRTHIIFMSISTNLFDFVSFCLIEDPLHSHLWVLTSRRPFISSQYVYVLLPLLQHLLCSP